MKWLNVVLNQYTDIVVGGIAIGVGIVIVLFSNNVPITLAASFSAYSVGGLIGFLFALPRKNRDKEDLNQSQKSEYLSNTNLEEVSDWLTKMLIGVGLTQLIYVPKYLKILSEYVLTNPAAFFLLIIVYFLIVGFGSIYLWTRIYLKPKFEAVDQNINDIIDRKSDQDAKALSLVSLYLSGEKVAKDDDKTVEILGGSIKDTSSSARISIFSQAYLTRMMNEPDAGNKIDKMKRCIPVFQALIKAFNQFTVSDQEIEPIDRYHAELGYAFKDIGNWDEAKENFDSAITKRDNWLKRPSPIKYYELSRAICNIKLDSNASEIINDLSSILDNSSYFRELLNNQSQKYSENQTNTTKTSENLIVFHWLKTKVIDQKDMKTINFVKDYENKYSADLQDFKSKLESYKFTF
jgi:tetratricopeptide (TPR) repeat protein